MLTDIISEPLLLEMLAKFCCSAALPNNSIIYRLTGFLIPNYRCFTLIGYTDSCDFLNVKIARINNG